MRPTAATYPVSELLDKMIDISDNTATNMLIRLVGRREINRQMERARFGDARISLGDVRTDGVVDPRNAANLAGRSRALALADGARRAGRPVVVERDDRDPRSRPVQHAAARAAAARTLRSRTRPARSSTRSTMPESSMQATRLT